MHFDKLSNEIKFDVFATLSAQSLSSTIAGVCREWRQFSYAPPLWRNVMLNGDKQTQFQIVDILTRCTRIRHLIIWHVVNFDWLVNVPIRKSVRQLQLRSCTITAKVMSQIVKTFPYVEIFFECLSSYNLDADPVVDEITRWNYLKALKLSKCDAENLCLDLVTNNCKVLTEFSAIGLKTINDRSFANFIDKHGPHLKSLEIGILDNLSGETFKSLCQCRQLSNLMLWKAKNFTDVEFCVLKDLPYLNNLKLCCGTLFTAEFL